MRDAEERGDLRGRHLLDLEKDEHRPHIHLHFVEHTVEKVARPSLIQELVGSGAAFEIDPDVGLGDLASNHRAPPNVGRDAHRRPEEKAPLAARSDRIDLARCDDEDLLRGVVRAIVVQAKASK